MLKYTYGSIPPFQKGLPANKRLDQELEKFIYIDLINKIDYWLGQDDDNEVVSTAIDCISD